MTYVEKVNYIKAELRTLLDYEKRNEKINNSVYRLGPDQNLHSLTYSDVKESLDKILKYEKNAKQPPIPPNLYLNSQLGGLAMPAGLGLLQPAGAGIAPFMPGAMPFAFPQQ